MATENEGLLVQIGATEKAYIQQLARMEARTLRAAMKSEKAFKDANPKIARSFDSPNRAAKAFAGDGLRNVSLQLNQVAQQGLVTGNYLQALSIQLPDLLLGFGTMGAVMGTVSALAVPLAANFLGAFDAQEALKEEAKRLEAALGDLKSAQDAAGLSVGQMAIKYGEAADEARANLLEILATQRALTEQGLVGAVRGVSEEFEAYLSPTLTDWRSSLERISEAFGVTRAEARTLAGAFNEMRQADTFEGQREALARIKSTLEEMGVPLKQIPEELLRAFLEADKLEDTALQIEALLGRSSDEAANVAGNIGSSADEAARLAENLGISLDAATRLAALGPQGLGDGNNDPSGKAYSGRGGDPRDFGGDAMGYQTAEAQMFLANWKPPAASSGKKGGGSSAKQTPFFGGIEGDITSLERQIEMIGMTSEQVAALTAKYQLLDEAKKRKLDLDARDAATGETLREQIARQADTVGTLTAKYEQAAERQQFFDQQNQAVKSGMIDAIVEGENLTGTLESVAKAFAKAALEAAIFGSGPLAGGLGGGGAITSLFSGLFGRRAGGGSLAAGRDYLVGENGPEIIRSRTSGRIMSASDTKAALRGGAAQGGGGSSSVHVSLDPGLRAEIVGESTNNAVKIAQAQSAAQARALGGNIQNYQKRGTSV